MLLCFVYFLFIYLLLLFFFLSFLYSVIRYSLSSPPRIAMLTAGYNGLCNLTQVNKVCVYHAVTCHLSVKTLLIASDKCPDLYLSIGRQEPINYGLLRKINIFAVNP